MAEAKHHDDPETLERTISEKSGLSDQEHIDVITPEEQKKIIRRIDRRLVLTLGFLYCVSLMDRTNLGIAAVGGMYIGMFGETVLRCSRELQLTCDIDLGLYLGYRYSTIALIFFPTYVILQPVATVVLRKLGPRIFLPSITVLWGATSPSPLLTFPMKPC